MPKVCPVWGTPATEGPPSVSGPIEYSSARSGGRYRVTDWTEAKLKQEIGEDLRWKARLTTWLVNQRRAGNLSPHIKINDVLAAGSARPLSYADKVDRFFLLLDRRAFNVGDYLNLEERLGPNHSLSDDIQAWCEVASHGELVALLQLLQAEGLIEPVRIGDYGLTPSGFIRLEAVARRSPNVRTAFVAMWFDQSTEAAYDGGIKPALAEAGYEPVRVDRLHPEGKIDDEIVAQIRRARFIVADFTCGTVPAPDGRPQPIHRGGVYYEAGFAQGIGIPVIWTVREDQIGAVHFDTRQFPHIVWATPDDLRVALYNRIAARIGIPPGVPDRRGAA